jgi:hypothetical protein
MVSFNMSGTCSGQKRGQKQLFCMSGMDSARVSVKSFSWFEKHYFLRKNNHLLDKKKKNLFSPGFFRVLKTAVLSRMRVGGARGITRAPTHPPTAHMLKRLFLARERKKFFFFIKHEVLIREATCDRDGKISNTKKTGNKIKKQWIIFLFSSLFFVPHGFLCFFIVFFRVNRRFVLL